MASGRNPPSESRAPDHRLSGFIHARRDDVVAEWVQAVRQLPGLRELDQPTLIDHIPDLLDRIAGADDELAAGRPLELPMDLASGHASARLDQGFDLGQVVAEYAVLRDCIVRLWAAEAGGGIDPMGLRALNQAIDRAIAAAVQGLAQQRGARLEAERNLAVLDTILASVSLGIGFLDTDLRYIRINPALAAVNGIPAEQHIGRTVREVLGAPVASLLEPILREVIETRRPVEDLELDVAPPSTPGQLRSFVVNYVPVVTGHGELLGIGVMLIDATERKQMELALRERELQFRSIADNIPQLAWMTDETGAIVWFNRRWYELTGTALDQVRGWGWQIVYHPDHAARVAEKWRRHLASGEVWEDTFPLRTADGRYRWFLSRAVPIRDESGRVVRWFGTNTDITGQRFMHEAMTVLSSSLDYRQTIANVARLAVPALGDWCFLYLVEGPEIVRVATTHTDPAKVALAEDLARRYPTDWNAPAGVPNVIRTGTTECVAEVADEDLLALTGDPELAKIAREHGVRSYVIAPLVARDRTLGAIAFVSAESGRRYTPADLALIEELGRRAGLAVDNARLFEAAQREARLREDILAVVSHDLKSPLGAIHLASTMLLAKAEPGPRRYLEAIHRAAVRMDHLIGDLLDMASIQAGRLSIERKSEDAGAIVREAFETHEPMAKEKGLSLVREDELGDARVHGDRDRILQVFGNLLGNALKFCNAGDTITIRGRRRGRELELAVADTGPDISDAELPHLFEPYWSAKKYAKQGTGLGLYISKGIVEAHGGRIWIERAPGAGKAFFFTVPIAPAAGPDRPG
jgi:PAS domain S-box-containing protein